VHGLELIGLGVLLTLVPAAAVTMLKGRWTLVLAGLCLLFPLLWYGAFALAAPGSWWSRRFYRGDKLERAAAFHDRWARRFAE
jgi:hypothetical protein